MSAPDVFDPWAPLPTGPTTAVLEASAGTGKTHTVATLVTRYLAEGVTTVDRLLVVTFSVAATRELRDRVRARLVRVRDALDGRGDDELAARLADAPAEVVAGRRRHLARAVADFDAATVATTHGFCQQALLALGTASPHPRGSELVPDVGTLTDEVVTDLYLRVWGESPAPDLSLDVVRALGRAAAQDPLTPLVPQDATGVPAMRVDVVERVRAGLAERKAVLGLHTYDDLVTSLARAVTDDATRDAARSRLRRRYDVVLADEFQDTDAAQWQILRDTFVGRRTVVLVGDPKQAIYAFRGADVQSYLRARAEATQVATLDVNWRSSAGLLRGLDAVLGGAALGDPDIVVRPVRPARPDSVVTGAGAPVRLRVLPRDDPDKPPTVGAARAAVADDAAAQVATMLAADATIDPGDGTGRRPLRPADVAVLVRTRDQAELVRAALRAAGVPAVATGGADVFASEAAQEWIALLEAVEQPQRRTRVGRLAIGPLLGVTAQALATDDGVRDGLRTDLARWSRVLDERGVAALWEAVARAGEVEPRLLARTDGERLVTDLRHLAQELDRIAVREGLGLSRLLTWLRRRVTSAGSGLSEHARKLESDAAAVQVSTVHTAKGLEFPVVLAPFAWDVWVPKDDQVVTAVYHDEHRERRRDVGGPGTPAWREHLATHRSEELGEELRLAYVAFTRAQARLVLWWAPTAYNTASSPLHRLLLRDPGDALPAERIGVPTHDEAMRRFGARAAGSDGALVVEEMTPGAGATWSPEREPPGRLDRRVLDRGLQAGWRRTSYSALTAAAHEQAVTALEPTGEAEVATTEDEAEVLPVGDAAAGGTVAPSTVSPWDRVPGGRHLGTVVHRVLEELPDAGDTEAVRALCDAYASRAGADADVLATALAASVATPLGPLAGGVAWSGLVAADRLPELDFELPLAGGDAAAVAPRLLTDLASVWAAHVDDGPLVDYPDALATLPPTELQGYLTGSIDAVVRVHAGDGPRYVVVDHKTNRLASNDETLTTWHYRPEALAEAMVQAHYPLQALLYQAALHRFLRWRQPGYEPARHLGGTLYLFLRGMTGPADPAGVFSWATPPGLVVAASDLLAGRA